jgi:hypothetical protein
VTTTIIKPWICSQSAFSDVGLELIKTIFVTSPTEHATKHIIEGIELHYENRDFQTRPTVVFRHLRIRSSPSF